MGSIKIYTLIVIDLLEVMSIQHWAEQPSSTFVNPGNDVVIACKINNKGGDCRWEKRLENKAPVPVGIYAGKYEWAGRTDMGDCSLKIIDVEPGLDDGRWICQVTASGFRESDTLISEEAFLSIRGKNSCIKHNTIVL